MALRKLLIPFGAPMAPRMVLKLPQGHEDSEYVLSFEIGQREGGFYSGRIDRHTEPPSTVLVYRFNTASIIHDMYGSICL